MNPPADYRASTARPMTLDSCRAALAFAALSIGVASTAVLPALLLWGLAARGFH